MSANTVAAPRVAYPSRTELRLRQAFSVGAPLLVGFLVTLPLLLLLYNSFNTAAPGREVVYGLQNWLRAFNEPTTALALWNSVALGATRTLISLPLAFALAWLIARSDMPGRSALEMFCWIGI